MFLISRRKHPGLRNGEILNRQPLYTIRNFVILLGCGQSLQCLSALLAFVVLLISCYLCEACLSASGFCGGTFATSFIARIVRFAMKQIRHKGCA
jgi:hypothetical protein